MASKSKWRLLRKFSSIAPKPPSPSRTFAGTPRTLLIEPSRHLNNSHSSRSSASSRTFTSRPLDLANDEAKGPAPIDYRLILEEDEFHKLADSTIHDLQEKLEEYGDSVQIDGFDVDYGNEVVTLKLGDLGTYVLNKQTPNRQIWLSSPVSGPSRFDWDGISQAWVYRRTKANLTVVLESELEQLCGERIDLS